MLSGTVHNLGITFAIDTFSAPPASNFSGIILCLGFWLVCQWLLFNVPALPSALGLPCVPACQRFSPYSSPPPAGDCSSLLLLLTSQEVGGMGFSVILVQSQHFRQVLAH